MRTRANGVKFQIGKKTVADLSSSQVYFKLFWLKKASIDIHGPSSQSKKRTIKQALNQGRWCSRLRELFDNNTGMWLKPKCEPSNKRWIKMMLSFVRARKQCVTMAIIWQSNRDVVKQMQCVSFRLCIYNIDRKETSSRVGEEVGYKQWLNYNRHESFVGWYLYSDEDSCRNARLGSNRSWDVGAGLGNGSFSKIYTCVGKTRRKLMPQTRSNKKSHRLSAGWL